MKTVANRFHYTPNASVRLESLIYIFVRQAF